MSDDLRQLHALLRPGESVSAEARSAEGRARQHLISAISKLPPSAVASKDALAAFKQRHLEMMRVKAAMSKEHARPA